MRNCAQGNAACGIETKNEVLERIENEIVHREMPRAALKLHRCPCRHLVGRYPIVHREMPRAALNFTVFLDVFSLQTCYIMCSKFAGRFFYEILNLL